jgi:hypothetical protein
MAYVTLALSKSKEPEFELLAAKTYAVMWNTLDVSVLEPLLANGVRNESQNILKPIIGKDILVDYLSGKFDAIRKGLPNTQPFVELAKYQGRNCLTMAQGSKEPPGAVVLLSTKNKKITEIGICTIIPRPEEVDRSGEYPTII